MPKPTRYIGITDFTKRTEVEQMQTVFRRHPNSHAFSLHVGVMMSYKTLKGIPTEWVNAFPPHEAIADIFGCLGTMNCLHFADREHRTSGEVAESLQEALAWGGSGMNALQLDMVWPCPEALRQVLEGFGRPLEVILQVGAEALAEVSNHPIPFIKRLGTYQGLITHVLLDKSGGRGEGMDAVGLLPFAHAIHTHFPHLGIVAAGGLSSSTMHLVAPLAQAIPDISIDAQGRLRPSGSALDPIDWGLAEQYLVAALDQLPT